MYRANMGDHWLAWETHRDLEKENPAAAAAYYAQNFEIIEIHDLVTEAESIISELKGAGVNISDSRQQRVFKRFNRMYDRAEQAQLRRLKKKSPAATAAKRSPMMSLGGKWEGMLEKGNLDISNRPSVSNPAGGTSSVYSMSIEVDGKEYLIPRVSEDGRLLTEKQATALFKRTGNHLGVFNSAGNATKYARSLHQQQAALGKR